MNLQSAITVAAVVVFVAATVVFGVFTITILQGINVLLELIAHSLEETP